MVSTAKTEDRREALKANITFLGTGAGEGYPAHWCECPHCTYARTHGGRNIRGNSSAIIDDELLIDLSPNAPMTAASLGISLAKVKTLLVTHAHEDHLYPGYIGWRYGTDNAAEMSYGEMLRHGGPRHTALPEMSICGNTAVKETLKELLDSQASRHIQYETLIPGQTIQVNGYAVSAVRGNHVNPEYTNNYVITRGGKTLLYASDTGYYDDETLKKVLSFHYDMVVMECTAGVNPGGAGPGHMSLDKNRKMLETLRGHGSINENAPFVLTHMSPHWTPPYDWFVSIAGNEGMTIAYDGLRMEI